MLRSLGERKERNLPLIIVLLSCPFFICNHHYLLIMNPSRKCLVIYIHFIHCFTQMELYCAHFYLTVLAHIFFIILLESAIHCFL